MRQRALALLTVLALAAATPGCVLFGGEAIEEPADEDIGDRGFVLKASDFHHHMENMERDTFRDDLPWPNGKGVATIELFYDLAGGREHVQILDADGTLVWEKTFTAGSGYEIVDVGAHARGEWKVILDREDVTGEMNIHLFQRATP